MTKSPSISVLVATRDRTESLEQLLTGLKHQNAAPSFEVLVADNSADESAAPVVESARRNLPVRRLHVPQPGKGRALNAALRQAAGDLLVFTDDDVDPHPNWLAELQRASVEHPEASVFGGRIEVLNPVPSWIRRSQTLMGLLTTGHERSEVIYGIGQYPFGPNMAVRRDLIRGIDTPYPQNMGPGTSLPVGDESAFLMPLSPPNARDRRYVPSASVVHKVLSSRLTLPAALRRARAQGRSQARLGIPMSLPSENAKRKSFPVQVARRLGACRSLSELACVLARQVGHVQELAARSPRPSLPSVPILHSLPGRLPHGRQSPTARSQP